MLVTATSFLPILHGSAVSRAAGLSLQPDPLVPQAQSCGGRGRALTGHPCREGTASCQQPPRLPAPSGQRPRSRACLSKPMGKACESTAGQPSRMQDVPSTSPLTLCLRTAAAALAAPLPRLRRGTVVSGAAAFGLRPRGILLPSRARVPLTERPAGF